MEEPRAGRPGQFGQASYKSLHPYFLKGLYAATLHEGRQFNDGLLRPHVKSLRIKKNRAPFGNLDKGANLGLLFCGSVC